MTITLPLQPQDSKNVAQSRPPNAGSVEAPSKPARSPFLQGRFTAFSERLQSTSFLLGLRRREFQDIRQIPVALVTGVLKGRM